MKLNPFPIIFLLLWHTVNKVDQEVRSFSQQDSHLEALVTVCFGVDWSNFDSSASREPWGVLEWHSNPWDIAASSHSFPSPPLPPQKKTTTTKPRARELAHRLTYHQWSMQTVSCFHTYHRKWVGYTADWKFPRLLLKYRSYCENNNVEKGQFWLLQHIP